VLLRYLPVLGVAARNRGGEAFARVLAQILEGTCSGAASGLSLLLPASLQSLQAQALGDTRA
jgi:hypothetical protein